MTQGEIKEQVTEDRLPTVIEAFVAGEFVATDPELQYLHTPHITSMALAMLAAAHSK